jgi:hypothetical protein
MTMGSGWKLPNSATVGLPAALSNVCDGAQTSHYVFPALLVVLAIAGM